MKIYSFYIKMFDNRSTNKKMLNRFQKFTLPDVIHREISQKKPVDSCKRYDLKAIK